jgi:hypothetical protein
MAAMRIGEYELIVEDQEGQVVWREMMTATTGHPCVGDGMLIGGNNFVVCRVCHFENEQTRASRRYTFAVVFVRLPVPAAATRRPRVRTARRG